MLVVSVLLLAAWEDGGAKPQAKIAIGQGSEVAYAKKKEKTVSKSVESVLNPNIAKMTEGDVEVLYSNKKPGYAHDMDGFVVTINEYQITKVSNVNRDSKHLFKNNTGGYVVTALTTYENKRKKPVYYAGSATLLMDDSFAMVYGDKFKFVPHEDVLVSDDPESVSKYPPGFKRQGFLSFVMTNEQYAKLAKTKPKLNIPGGASERKDFRGSDFGEAVFDFIYSEKNKKEVEAGPHFYRDNLTNKNIADKKMIVEKKGDGKKLKIDGVEVTLEGVQYTEITPSAEYKSTFRNFSDDGIVALTVKLTINNKSKETIGLGSLGIGSILSVDDNRFRYFTQGKFEPEGSKKLKPGQSGEKLHVFLIDKDQFANHKKFELIFGPFSGDDAKKLFKGQDAQFTLPR